MADMRGEPTPDEFADRMAKSLEGDLDLLTRKRLASLYLAVQGEAYERKLSEEEMEELVEA